MSHLIKVTVYDSQRSALSKRNMDTDTISYCGLTRFVRQLQKARGGSHAFVYFVCPSIPEESEKLLVFYPTNIMRFYPATVNVEFVDGSYLYFRYV